MTDYLGWAGKFIKGFYNDMNPATLTGANDVIIIKQEDGTYKTSPWHIRFGKMGVFWTSENNVDVEINGQSVNLPMKLGTAGDAIFAINFEDYELLNNNNMNNSTVKLNNNTTSDIEENVEQHSTSVEQHSTNVVLLCPQISNPNEGNYKADEPHQSFVMDSTDVAAEGKEGEVAVVEMDSLQQMCSDMQMEGHDTDVLLMTPLSKMRCNSLPEISCDDLNMGVDGKTLSDDGEGEEDMGCTVGSLPSSPNDYLSERRPHENPPNMPDWHWDALVQTSDNINNNISTDVVTQVTEVKDGQDKKEASANQTKGKVEGIYLDQLMDDPELLSLYIYPNSGPLHEISQHSQDLPKDVDCRSDPGLPLSPFSAPHSPVPFDEELTSRTRAMSLSASDRESMSSSRARLDCISASTTLKVNQQRQANIPSSTSASALSDINISLCGGLEDLHDSTLLEKFEQNKVTFKQFASNPALLNDPSLVVQIGGKFFKWAVASSMIMSLLVFQEPLPDEAKDHLMKQHMPQKVASHRRRWLGGWFSGKEKGSTGATAQMAVDSGTESDGGGPPSKSETSPAHKELQPDDLTKELPYGHDLSDNKKLAKEQQQSMALRSIPTTTQAETNKSEEDYAKVLTLTAKQIELMNLHEGHNEMTFSITTKYQGTTKCHCSVFLWNWFDRIVISDIDGTITKSDVLGQVLPIISSTWIWSQVGIANLYTLIHQNGYKFIYLSARAIGQAKLTRDYLRSVKQGEYLLPDGPLLLSPSSLRNAFHKEVIERKPEEFKIKCLKNILSLFPSSTANPFMAGFGNRVNDVFAYNTVGIPKERIFIVNTKGQLRIEKSTTFSSTYSKLRDIVDQIFPPVAVDPEYSSFNYWRDTSQIVSDDEALKFMGISKNKKGRKVERSSNAPTNTLPSVTK